MCHFPPGTSKWNKIEHRLFCHITRTWRARPLMTREDAVAGIAATVTGQGLKCTAVLDDAQYPGGARVSDERMRTSRTASSTAARSTASGTTPSRPPPAPPRSRSRALALALALTWKRWPRWPASATCPPCWAPSPSRSPPPASSACTWPAACPAGRDGGGGQQALPYEAVITAAACRLRLGMPWRLLGELLGVDTSTVSLAGSRAIPLLAAHGITPGHAGPASPHPPSCELRRGKRNPRRHRHNPASSSKPPETPPPPNATRPNLKTDAPITPLTLHKTEILHENAPVVRTRRVTGGSAPPPAQEGSRRHRGPRAFLVPAAGTRGKG